MRVSSATLSAVIMAIEIWTVTGCWQLCTIPASVTTHHYKVWVGFENVINRRSCLLHSFLPIPIKKDLYLMAQYSGSGLVVRWGPAMSVVKILVYQ